MPCFIKRWLKHLSFNETKWEAGEKIVIAIDCGTTFSGVAYSYLYPSGRQSVQPVLQWPGQPQQRGEAKIPTLVWYDNTLKARAFGAEALSPQIRKQADREGWQLAEHFKLHLHPRTMRAEQDIIVQPLPKGVPIEQIYADFFEYLYRGTQTFFEKQEVNGSRIWKMLESSIEFVIACPNGWGPWEQGFLRKAAVLGGLVESSQSMQRVHFVSEAEASVHFAITHGDQFHLHTLLQKDVDFLVCDAGGSTVDTTVYTVSKTHPNIELKEKQGSACIQAGAIFVNQTAAETFHADFIKAGYEGDQLRTYVEEAVDSFEMGAKRAFSGPDQDDLVVEVGGHKFTDKSVSIQRGRMSLSSEKVQKFFSPWVKQIEMSVEEQMQGHSVKYIILVGGFGDSPYLRKRFEENSAFEGTKLILANDASAKAVAEGAAIWHIKQAVAARATRFAYGASVLLPHKPSDPEHQVRKVQHYPDRDLVSGHWNEIVGKDEVIWNDKEWRSSFHRTYDSPNPDLGSITMTVFVYAEDTDEGVPRFVYDKNDNLNDGFYKACVIKADMSNMKGALSKYTTGVRGTYWAADYSIAILFGKTELSAQLVWKDKEGKEHRSEAVVLPEKFT